MTTAAPHRAEETALGLAVAGLGAIFLWSAGDIPPSDSLVGARTVPAIASGLILAGGLAIALRAWVSAVPGIGSGKPQKFLRIVLPATLLALAFLWLWSAVGWTLASLVIAPAFFAIFGARGWKELLLFPNLVVTLLYLVFYVLLGLWHETGWVLESLGF
jgi:hypothetical protein